MTIRIWDAETGAISGEPFMGHTSTVWSVAYSPDGRHIISGSNNSTIRIWDAETTAGVDSSLELRVCCLSE
jgi:WD40 repeat protein